MKLLKKNEIMNENQPTIEERAAKGGLSSKKMSGELMERVNFDTVLAYCMNECVTYNELKPVYEMFVLLMGDCTDEEWLCVKRKLKAKKQELAGEDALRDALSRAVDNGRIELMMGKSQKKEAKRSVAPKLTNATFAYRYLNECPNRIMLLYQGLVKGELIDKTTKPDDFMALFEGKPSNVKIKWLGSLASLWYLFKVMLGKGLVVKPEGVGQWIVVQSHFVDERSKMFADFNKQKPPLKLKEVLEVMAELLNPNSYEDLM